MVRIYRCFATSWTKTTGITPLECSVRFDELPYCACGNHHRACDQDIGIKQAGLAPNTAGVLGVHESTSPLGYASILGETGEPTLGWKEGSGAIPK